MGDVVALGHGKTAMYWDDSKGQPNLRLSLSYPLVSSTFILYGDEIKDVLIKGIGRENVLRLLGEPEDLLGQALGRIERLEEEFAVENKAAFALIAATQDRVKRLEDSQGQDLDAYFRAQRGGHQ